MKLSQRLTSALQDGINQIGEVSILTETSGSPYALCHYEDRARTAELAIERGPFAAQEIGKLNEDNEFRFLKGSQDLRRGWLLLLADVDELRQALDLLYPAALGLWLAQQDKTLRVQDLRPKLKRQTGMYRFAHTISDAGAQALVKEECHPTKCAKRILWNLDEGKPLEESEASRWSGRTDKGAIPLLCQEACNHLVSQCRKAAKAEADAAKG